MIPIGSVLFLLFAPMGVGGLLLLATVRRGQREGLSGLLLAAFFFVGLAVSIFPLQEVPSHRGLVLGLYIAGLIIGFAAALLYLRNHEQKGLSLLLLLSGASGLAALLVQSLGTGRIHSVNLDPWRLALDLGLSVPLMGGLLAMGYLIRMDRVGSPLFSRANRWVLISALIKAALSGRYLMELAGLDLFAQGFQTWRWPLFFTGLHEIGLLGVLIGTVVIWYSARRSVMRVPGLVLSETLIAGVLMELCGKILIVQWRVLV